MIKWSCVHWRYWCYNSTMIRNAVNRRHISTCSYRFSFRQSQKVSRLAIGDLKKKVPKPSGIFDRLSPHSHAAHNQLLYRKLLYKAWFFYLCRYQQWSLTEKNGWGEEKRKKQLNMSCLFCIYIWLHKMSMQSQGFIWQQPADQVL